MKKFVLSVVTVLLLGNYISAQQCEWVYDFDKSYKIPVGKCTVDEIKQGNYYRQMVENTLQFNLNGQATLELAQVLTNKGCQHYAIDIYFGAWDDASLVQLPRFIMFERTMEAKYQQPIQCNYYGCNRESKCGQASFEPQTLPTFVVYQVGDNGQRTQIGLIEENPQQSFEEHILNIIKH